MTLQEFASRNERNSFVKNKLEEIKHNITMAEAANGEERTAYWNTANNFFYAVWGYIAAAYDYGDIPWDVRTALTDELMELFED